jgi:hypothetical protein
MSRGLTDDILPEQLEQPEGDLPTIPEMDQAIRQLYEMLSELNIRVDVIKDILGASIATQDRREKNNG